MQIQILKSTPYRKGIEKEIKIGTIHEVKRVCYNPIFKIRTYIIDVDDRERIILKSDCREMK